MGGRPPYDPVMMLKVLVIQTANNLSDERTEFLINDRLSFMRFLGLGLSNRVTAGTKRRVWTTPALQGLSERFRRSQRLQSCIRPCSAVLSTAGPDGFRGSTARQMDELKVRIVSWALADPGPTGSPSSFSHPRKPDARRLWAPDSVSDVPPLPDRFPYGRASPKRHAPSCAREPSPPRAQDVEPEAVTARAAV
jgi:hypothetical protein